MHIIEKKPKFANHFKKKHCQNQMAHWVSHIAWVLELYALYDENIISRCDEVHFDDVLYRCTRVDDEEQNDFDARWKQVHPPLLQRQFGFFEQTGEHTGVVD